MDQEKGASQEIEGQAQINFKWHLTFELWGEK